MKVARELRVSCAREEMLVVLGGEWPNVVRRLSLWEVDGQNVVVSFSLLSTTVRGSFSTCRTVEQVGQGMMCFS